jgi:hypothetical protein
MKILYFFLLQNHPDQLTQPFCLMGTGIISQGYSGWGMKCTTDLHYCQG